MADKAWKAFERKTAKKFGMKRALQKGTTAKEDIAPEEGIDAAPWIIDCKKRKRLEVWTWMRELTEYADEKGKPPILVFQPWGKRQSYAVVDSAWFRKNFSSHMDFFNFVFFFRTKRQNFVAAWEAAMKGTNKKKQFPALAMFANQAANGELCDYVCIKLENLISLMEAKNMLEVDDL